MHRKMGILSSFVMFTKTLVVLCNNPSAAYRLVYHGLLIRASPFLQTVEGISWFVNQSLSLPTNS